MTERNVATLCKMPFWLFFKQVEKVKIIFRVKNRTGTKEITYSVSKKSGKTQMKT
jgi:hypothetical protein